MQPVRTRFQSSSLGIPRFDLKHREPRKHVKCGYSERTIRTQVPPYADLQNPDLPGFENLAGLVGVNPLNDEFEGVHIPLLR
jgi:hypothetical protein